MRNTDEDHCFCNAALPYLCEQLKEDEPRWIRVSTLTALKYYNTRIGALIEIWALVNKNTFEEAALIRRGALIGKRALNGVITVVTKVGRGREDPGNEVDVARSS